MMTKACRCCGKQFRVFPTTENKRVYCSRRCSQEHRKTIEPERFWSHVDCDSGWCWEWTGSRNAFGYGCFMPSGAGQLVLAHRYSWSLASGRDPGDAKVLHACDNPACVRPAHLFLGTIADNSADMIAKGRARHPRGSENHESKLTETQVTEIRRIYRRGRKNTPGPHAPELAERYDVSVALIYDIVKRRTWRHVP